MSSAEEVPHPLEEEIVHFMEVTGADRTAAIFHLEAAGGSSEMAISMFFGGLAQHEAKHKPFFFGSHSDFSHRAWCYGLKPSACSACTSHWCSATQATSTVFHSAKTKSTCTGKRRTCCSAKSHRCLDKVTLHDNLARFEHVSRPGSLLWRQTATCSCYASTQRCVKRGRQDKLPHQPAPTAPHWAGFSTACIHPAYFIMAAIDCAGNDITPHQPGLAPVTVVTGWCPPLLRRHCSNHCRQGRGGQFSGSGKGVCAGVQGEGLDFLPLSVAGVVCSCSFS